MLSKNKPQSTSRFLIAAAAVVIILGALKISQAFFVPILLAAFIATISFPITSWLRRHGVPRFFAVLLTVLVDFAFLTGIVLIGISLAGGLQAKWKGENGEPGYEKLMWTKLQAGTNNINELLKSWGIEEANVSLSIEEPMPSTDLVDSENATSAPETAVTATPATEPEPRGFINSNRLQEQLFQLDFGKVLDLSTNVAFGILSFFGTTLLILILTVFMLTEARMFARQVEAICEARGPNLQRIFSAAQDVQRYLAIKAVISLATGILAGFLCWVAGLDLFVLWGIIAFVLNFIPVIGSIISAVPPVLLALLVTDGISTAVVVAIGFIAINFFLGNFLEPMLLGRRFGLPTLVVLIAVLFWGWLWGPAGMLLAVPLTMVVKAGLDNSEEFRWLSIAISTAKTPSSDEKKTAEALTTGEKNVPV